MRTNLLLTGDRGVGKSTCLGRTLEGATGEVRGFRTYFADGARAELLLADHLGRRPRVVARRQEGGFRVLEDVFEDYGTALLHAGRGAELVVMDELGKLERGCPRFRRAVLEALEGPVPVLGVLRQGEGEWLELLRRHPAVEVLTVDAGNREALPGQLRARLCTLAPGLFAPAAPAAGAEGHSG